VDLSRVVPVKSSKAASIDQDNKFYDEEDSDFDERDNISESIVKTKKHYLYI
jgi:hypothetical protein